MTTDPRKAAYLAEGRCWHCDGVMVRDDDPLCEHCVRCISCGCSPGCSGTERRGATEAVADDEE